MAPVDKAVTRFWFPSTKVQHEKHRSSRTPPSTICNYEERPIATDTSKIEICAKTTCRCQISLGISPSAVHITQYRLDTEGGINFVNKTLIPQLWKNHIQRRSLPRLRTAAKQPLHIEGKIALHVRFGPLCVRA